VENFPRIACPPWCRVDHGTQPGGDHRGDNVWFQPRLDGVTAGVRLVAFADGNGATEPAALVSLRLRQRDIADKDSIELTPTEARRLAAMLMERAAAADQAFALAAS
jgi:hypothetical protein